jgi:hypothetical protein
MNRLIRLLVTLAIVATVLLLTQNQTEQFMVQLNITSIYTLILVIYVLINLLIEIVLCVALKKKLDNTQYLLSSRDELFVEKNEYIKKLNKNILNCEDVMSNQVEEISNLNKRIRILTQHDNTTIKLGDLVTSTAYHKPTKLYAMKLSDNGILYQLTKGGKFKARNEIKKVEEVKKKWHAPGGHEEA